LRLIESIMRSAQRILASRRVVDLASMVVAGNQVMFAALLFAS